MGIASKTGLTQMVLPFGDRGLGHGAVRLFGLLILAALTLKKSMRNGFF